MSGKRGKEEYTAEVKLSQERSLQLKLMTVTRAHTKEPLISTELTVYPTLSAIHFFFCTGYAK